MSFDMVDAVIKKSSSNGSAKLVMIIIAHCHNSKSGQCNPSYETISAMSGLSRATVARCISYLVDIGELIRITAPIARSAKGYSQESNNYEIHPALCKSQSETPLVSK